MAAGKAYKASFNSALKKIIKLKISVCFVVVFWGAWGFGVGVGEWLYYIFPILKEAC